MSRMYRMASFAVALVMFGVVVFGVVTDVFGMLYMLSTAPGWVQAGAVVRIILMLIWLGVVISDFLENR